MPMTYDLANQLANATVANVSYSSPANVYTALYSVAPTYTTTGTEITGNGYSRQLTTFGTPTDGVISSTANVSFSCTGNNWPAVKAVGITDASTGGNIMFFQTIATRNVEVGDSLIFDSGNIQVSIS